VRIERGFPDGTIIENSKRVVKDTGNGDLLVEPEVIGSEDLINQYQSGYRCLKCHGVVDQPFPEVCPAEDKTRPNGWKCGYRMRDRQAADFAGTRGEGYWGPTPLSHFDDERERERWTPKSGIWVPGQ
jgi:hypothetical protein